MVVLTSPVKCLFPTLQVCTLWLVALFQQGAHHLTLSPLFVSYWDMMKCIFLHKFLLLYSLSCEQASREQISLILVAVELTSCHFRCVTIDDINVLLCFAV